MRPMSRPAERSRCLTISSGMPFASIICRYMSAMYNVPSGALAMYTWFRPVYMANAPDGTLYIADMYRQIIEAKGIPDEIVKHLDLSAGRDMGRIYRIVPEG